MTDEPDDKVIVFRAPGQVLPTDLEEWANDAEEYAAVTQALDELRSVVDDPDDLDEPDLIEFEAAVHQLELHQLALRRRGANVVALPRPA